MIAEILLIVGIGIALYHASAALSAVCMIGLFAYLYLANNFSDIPAIMQPVSLLLVIPVAYGFAGLLTYTILQNALNLNSKLPALREFTICLFLITAFQSDSYFVQLISESSSQKTISQIVLSAIVAIGSVSAIICLTLLAILIVAETPIRIVAASSGWRNVVPVSQYKLILLLSIIYLSYALWPELLRMQFTDGIINSKQSMIQALFDSKWGDSYERC